MFPGMVNRHHWGFGRRKIAEPTLDFSVVKLHVEREGE
jgi:hypothetical protein